MTDEENEDWEKKSERFEVRLSHSKKTAFQKACDDNGDTPSEAVRRFIDGYLNRADIDFLAAAGRSAMQIFRRNWKPTLAAFLIGFPIAYYVSTT